MPTIKLDYMRMRLILFLFFSGFLIQANSQSALIGSWRQVSSKPERAKMWDKQPIAGDLEIRSDSTFHIAGDALKQTSEIEGWHIGEAYNGTWQLKNKRLTLWLAPKADGMFLSYVVVRLTKNKLVLRSSFTQSSNEFVVTYLRL